jgi:hypothetical protein
VQIALPASSCNRCISDIARVLGRNHSTHPEHDNNCCQPLFRAINSMLTERQTYMPCACQAASCLIPVYQQHA